MKRTYVFVKSTGMVKCVLPSGQEIEVPAVPGLLKHPTTGMLRGMLKDPDVVRKYTIEALRKAPWPVLRQFPREWLEECMKEADLEVGRRKALAFLLATSQ